MRNTIFTLAGAMVVSLFIADNANAAGRESILARLNSPFGTLSYSRFRVNPYGLPALQASNPFTVEEPAAVSVPIPVIAVEGVDQTAPETAAEPAATTEESAGELVFTPLSAGSPRPPYRPRVRSPFRPPPRPSF